MTTITRNSQGLLENLEYKTDKLGYIIWRDMIPSEYLYPNKEYFARNNLSAPESAEGLPDNQCLVKIGGLIELMKIRGYTSLDQQVLNVDNGYVTAKCTITWLPNSETDNKPVTFSWVANSNIGNCGDFMANFQETQAQNRALSLCVRKFLNVNIVSDEEMSKGQTNLIPEKEKPAATLPNLNNKLRKKLLEANYKSPEALLALIEEMKAADKIQISPEDLMDENGKVSVDPLGAKECRIIMGYLDEKKKGEK